MVVDVEDSNKILKKKRKLLTDNGEIHLLVSGRWVFEIYSTPVDPFVLDVEPVDAEMSRTRCGDEKSSGAESRGGRPQRRVVEIPFPDVEAGKKDN